MVDKPRLATRACLLGRLALWGPFDPGELALSDGVVSFTPDESPDQRPLFAAPLDEVKVRFPKLYFGLGLQLVVTGKRYRIWFLPLRSAVGETTSVRGDKQTIAVDAFHTSDLGPARAATREWRTALSQVEA